MYVAVRLHRRDPATRGLKFIIATGEPALRALTRVAGIAKNRGRSSRTPIFARYASLTKTAWVMALRPN